MRSTQGGIALLHHRTEAFGRKVDSPEVAIASECLAAEMARAEPCDPRGQGTCSNRPGIPRGYLEGPVLYGLKERLMTPGLVETFVREVPAETNGGRHREEGPRCVREKDLAKVERRLTGLIDAVADVFRAPSLQQQPDEAEASKATLLA